MVQRLLARARAGPPRASPLTLQRRERREAGGAADAGVARDAASDLLVRSCSSRSMPSLVKQCLQMGHDGCRSSHLRDKHRGRRGDERAKSVGDKWQTRVPVIAWHGVGGGGGGTGGPRSFVSGVAGVGSRCMSAGQW